VSFLTNPLIDGSIVLVSYFMRIGGCAIYPPLITLEFIISDEFGILDEKVAVSLIDDI
jgi:hypothetical protein